MKSKTIVMTKGISDAMEGNFKFFNEVMVALDRYSNHDWGYLCEEDKRANEDALIHDGQIFAKYSTSEGSIYIITEWDRSVTTVLFPSEY